MATSESLSVPIIITGDAPQTASEIADSFENAQKQIEEATNSIKSMKVALANLKGGGAASKDAAAKLYEQMRDQKGKLAAAQLQKMQAQGLSKKPLAEKIQENKQKSVKPAESSNMGAAVTAASKNIYMAILALTTAIGASVAGIASKAIVAADAFRTEKIQLEAMTKQIYPMQFGFMRAAGNVNDLEIAIDSVADSTAATRSELIGMTQQLYAAGLRGGNLQTALQAMATVATTQGPAAASQFASMASGAAFAGQSVNSLAARIDRQLGPLAKRSMLSLTNQTLKFKDNASRLFRDVKIEGFLSGLNEVGKIFSQNTVFGMQLKHTIEQLLNPIFGNSENAGKAMAKFFAGAFLGFQRLETVGLKMILSITQTRGFPWIRDLITGLDWMKISLTAGYSFFTPLIGAIGMTSAAVNGLTAAAGVLMPAFQQLNNINNIFQATLISAANTINGFQTQMVNAGKNLVMGVVNGVWGAASSLNSAIQGVAKGAVDTFTGALGIHSPSKVFEEKGKYVGEGAAIGISAGGANVDAAVGELSKGASSAFAPSPAPGKSSGTQSANGGLVINISEIMINANTKEGGKEAAIGFREEMNKLFEEFSIQLGAA